MTTVTRSEPSSAASPADRAAEPDPNAFPPGFVWGAATAAYQIEGAVDVDGRGPSIWDRYAAEPGRTANGETGEVAADHYRRWPEDITLMSELGLDAYRLSISWPRIQPTGSGAANLAGLGFYDRLVDGLLDCGIDPWITLYHWDLPTALEDAGGWPARDTAHRFAEFAAIAADALGDRVGHWITLNEPWCSAFLGYSSGRHAPGRTNHRDAVAAAHHLMLGHGLATTVIRSAAPAAKVGVTLNLYAVTTADDSEGAHEAVRQIDGIQNRWFLDPILKGGYPDDVRRDLAGTTAMEFERPDDAATIAAPVDFLGVNYYTRYLVQAGPYPGSAGIEFVSQGLPRTAMGWEVDHTGLEEVLTRVTRDYGPIPIVVTENGAAFDDVVGADGEINDSERRAFVAAHLLACQQAIGAGVPLKGYFVWSLLDNYEWAYGYAKRFGIIHVDFATQERRIKASGRWYADFLARYRDGILPP
jgi:beta-glucosidase